MTLRKSGGALITTANSKSFVAVILNAARLVLIALLDYCGLFKYLLLLYSAVLLKYPAMTFEPTIILIQQLISNNIAFTLLHGHLRCFKVVRILIYKLNPIFLHKGIIVVEVCGAFFIG